MEETCSGLLDADMHEFGRKGTDPQGSMLNGELKKEKDVTSIYLLAPPIELIASLRAEHDS